MGKQIKNFGIYLFINVLLLITSCSKAQENCLNPEDIIPTNRKIYMIGEGHLDVAENPKMGAGKTQIKHQLAAENEIIKHFVLNCGVKNFIVEAPIYMEYYFTKFMETGDSAWIDFIHQDYQLGKLYNINNLAKKDTNI